MKALAMCAAIGAVLASSAKAQNQDQLPSVPIKLYAAGAMSRQSTNDTGKLSLELGGTVVASATIQSGQSLGNFATNTATVGLRTGVTYTIVATALIPDDGDYFAAGVSFVAPAGYQIYIGGVPSTETQVGLAQGANTVPLQICVMGPSELASGRAGSCTSIVSGQVYWRVNMGSLENGDTAGSIVLSDPGTGSWGPLGTRAALAYMAPSYEIAPYTDANGLRQILGDQANVDIVSFADGSYEIRFYDPKVSPKQGTAFPYTFTNLPYVSYHVQVSTTGSSPETDVLTITSVTHIASDLVTNVALATSSPDPGTTATARIAVTTLTMTRTPSASDYTNTYVWTLNDWNTSGVDQVIQETRTWGGTANARTETRALSTAGSTGNALYTSKSYVTYPFGEQLASISLGSSNPKTATYSTYTDQSNVADYGFPEEILDNSGTWVANDYTGQGQVADVYRAFNNAPTGFTQGQSSGTVESYTYSNDPFGMPTRIASITTNVNGDQCAKTVIAYQNLTTLYNNETVVSSSEVKSTGGSASLTTTKKFYAEDDDPFYASKPFSEIRPDGTMVDYAYEVGSFIAGEPENAADSKLTVITGTSVATGETQQTVFDATCDIDPIYPVAKMSMATVTIRNFKAEIARVETYVWIGGWNLVDTKDYTYDNAGFLTAETDDNTALTRSRVYSGEQLTSETDAMGLVTSYSNFDGAGRALTVSKTGAATSTLAFDAANRLTSNVQKGASDTLTTSYSFDDAGRLVSESHPGSGTTGYAYSYDATGWSLTATAADGGTTITTYNIDGRIASVTGTAVVNHTYAYQYNEACDLQTTDYLGSLGTSSARTIQTITDWIGRTVETIQPGFNGAASFVESRIYDSNGTFSAPGHLVELSRSGFAPILFNYDSLGNVSLVGMDLANSGQLTLSSNDRIIGYNQGFTFDGTNYWYQQSQQVYPWAPGGTPTASTPETIMSTQERLTGLSAGELSDVQSFDEYNNMTETTVTVNSSTNTRKRITTYPGIPATSPGIETISYSASGLLDQTTSPDGLTTSKGFDVFGRLVSTTDSRNNQSIITPTPGTPWTLSVADASGATTSYQYDALGRPTEITDPNSNITYRDYWPTGLLHHQWGPGSYPVVHTYDDYGNEVSMLTYQNGTWTSATWPGDTNQPSAQTTWVYDSGSGLLASKQDAEGNKVKYTYNGRGQILTRSLARGGNPTTTYAYYGDGPGEADTGELKSQTYSDSTPDVSYQYTRLGQLYSVTDATGVRDFVYNASVPTELDGVQLSSAFYNNLLLTQLYDKDGLLTGRPSGFQLGTTASPSADLEQDYYFGSTGLFSKVVSQSANNTVSSTFTYSYFPSTHLIGGYTVANSFQVSRTYEAKRDVLASVVTQQLASGGNVTLAEFDLTSFPNGQRQYSQQSGAAYGDYYAGQTYQAVYNAFTYDARGELSQAMTYRGTAPGSSGSPSSSDALPGRVFNYAYDNIGNRTESGPFTPHSLANDSASYLSGNEIQGRSVNTERILGNAQAGAEVSSNLATLGVLDRNYGGYAVVSPTGTPTASTVTVSASLGSGGSAVEQSSSSTFLLPSSATISYDADGNLSFDGFWNYSYDAENRLVSMKSVNPGVGGLPYQITFTYDYLGRRVEKQIQNTSNSGTTFDRKYVYDGRNLIAEINSASNSIVRTYAWGLDETGTLDGAGGVGGLLSLANVSGSTVTTYYAGCDGNGNISLLFNPASGGSLAAIYEYSPFGELLRVKAPDSSVADNPFRFSSRFSDLETGLVCMDARYYSPGTGRFINRDPMGEAGGLNLYGFCSNDALDKIDPWGTGESDGSDESIRSFDDDPILMDPVGVVSDGNDGGGDPGDPDGWSSSSGSLNQATHKVSLPGLITFTGPLLRVGAVAIINGQAWHIDGGGKTSDGSYLWDATPIYSEAPPTMQAQTATMAELSATTSALVQDLNPGIGAAVASVSLPPAAASSGGAPGFWSGFQNGFTLKNAAIGAGIGLIALAAEVGSFGAATPLVTAGLLAIGSYGVGKATVDIATSSNRAYTAGVYFGGAVSGAAGGGAFALADGAFTGSLNGAAETGADAAATLPSKLYHYTGAGNADSILENGLQLGSSGKVFTTTAGDLTPLQAQIELALPANRGLPGALFEIDTSALPQPVFGPGRVLPTATAPGGGVEVIFGQPIPPSALTRLW